MLLFHARMHCSPVDPKALGPLLHPTPVPTLHSIPLCSMLLTQSCLHIAPALQLFDPTDLTEDVTPAACRAALAAGAHVRAALIALRLGDPSLLRACVFATPPAQIQTVAGALPAAFLPQVGCWLTLPSKHVWLSHQTFLLPPPHEHPMYAMLVDQLRACAAFPLPSFDVLLSIPQQSCLTPLLSCPALIPCLF
jgi:hypothetical protein